MVESIWLTAFMVGLLGGVHCLGMCGPVVGTLTFSLAPKVQSHWQKMLPFQLAYNLGRISSYSIIGLIFGYLGSQVISLAQFLPMQQVLQFFAGSFMVALGLYLGNWWGGVTRVEKLGAIIWLRLKPFTQKLVPVNNLFQAFLYGALWGWLPCGLVYSMVIMALGSGSALSGAGVMLAFGLGTLPNLLLMGSFAFFFTRLSRNVLVRKIAGAMVMVMGGYQIYLSMVVTVN